MRVLECLARRAEPMPLSDIAESVEANKSTVSRMLETLKHHGYVQQEGRRGSYRAGLKVLTLSANIFDRMLLPRKAGPFMYELGEESGCEIFLAAATQGRAVIISVYYPKGRRICDVGSFGHESSFYCTALGKVVAAFQPRETIHQLIRSETLVRRTEQTMTDRNRLLEEYNAVRETGRGFSRYENSPDTFGTAAPIRNHEGRVIAALGLAAPKSRAEEHGEGHFADMLATGAERISFALGYAAESMV